MKKFWNEYGKLIKRMWLNLFGAAVFGFSVLFCAQALVRDDNSHNFIYVIAGIISAVFYGYLLYLLAWEAGAKDKIRADGGRTEPCPNRGLKIALVYTIPAAVFIAVYLVTSIVYHATGTDNKAFLSVLNFSGMIGQAFQMPFVCFGILLFGNLGVNIAKTGDTLPYALFLAATLAPAVLVIWLGYLFGYHGKFKSKMYGPKKKNEE